MAKAFVGASLNQKIVKSFQEYLLENGQKPESIYSFCKKIKIKESDFYDEFNSFAQIENVIWQNLFNEAATTTKAELVYEEYSVREKFLSLYYTWIEVLKANRSFILIAFESMEKPIYLHKNAQLADFKYVFVDFANELLIEAKETREVEPRAIPQLMQFYPTIFWAKTLLILDFWINDDSKSFEKTDTMIEKSVNTVFDLLARSPLDSLIDLGKFMYQNRS
ncbi:MAG: TetR family transcriptional regulator C-terminal domain-containing protein [Bacteroidota bacterium]